MGRWLFYFFMLITSFVFTYIFDVKENYVILYMLILMPFVDYITYRYFRNKLEVKINVLSDNTEKNEKVFCNLEFTNKGVMPIPFIDYKISYNNKIKSTKDIYERLSLGKNETLKKELDLIAVHIGIGEIELNLIEIRSIFGLFHNNITMDKNKYNIMISPKCVEVYGMETLLEDVLSSEDEDGVNDITLQGSPGYEYKEYVAGDPLNRVNWKLSSKKNILMIRKSTALNKCKKLMVLDSYVLEDENYDNNCDLIIEGFLGVTNFLFLDEYEIDVAISKRGKWEITSINKNTDIKELQRLFSNYKFCNAESSEIRFYEFGVTEEENYDLVLFTTNKDKPIEDFVINCEHKYNSISIIGNNRKKILEEEFYLQKDYELERI